MDENKLMINEKLWPVLFRLIEEAREAKGLSQEQAAAIFGKQRQTWNRIVTGKTGTTRRTLESMAKAIDRDLDELLEAARVEVGITSERSPAAETAAAIVGSLKPTYQKAAIVTLKGLRLLSMSGEKEDGEDGKSEKDERPHHPARKIPVKGEKAPPVNKVPKDNNGANKDRQPRRQKGVAGR